MPSFNWTCPHCSHAVAITDRLLSGEIHRLDIKNADGKIALGSQFIVCANNDCMKPTLGVFIQKWTDTGDGDWAWVGEKTTELRLLPFGASRPYPDHVPVAIRNDYKEACLIRDLSPKSAAALARRTLQGILRDFYKVKPGRLVAEIDALEETMEPELFEAIHGVRTVGNIGAHMEADINVIVEVEPGEAQLLIELVETLIEETYIRREARARRLKKVADLSKAKELERKGVVAPVAARPAKPA